VFLYLFLLVECVYLFPATWATYRVLLCGAKNGMSTTPSGPNPPWAAKNRILSPCSNPMRLSGD
jgi:hypothetical protein